MSRRQLVEAAATAAIVIGVGLVVCLATGFVSVVTTRGTSMLPRFHTGDLALVWAWGGYHVGEIVAYWSPLLHTLVLHRIVAHAGGLYTFKGDHNPFLDPLRLPSSAIKGSLFLHIPHAGGLYRWLRSPLHLVLVGGLLLLLVGGTAPVSARAAARRAARRAGRATEPDARPVAARATPAPVGRAAVPLIAAAVLAGAAVFAWVRPLQRTVSKPRPYHQQVSFSYWAPAAPSLVYPGGKVQAGQPIFLDLVHNLNISARFRVSAPAPGATVRGALTASVRLVSGNGWSSVLERLPAVPLRASQATVTATVDLAQVAHDIAIAARETGVEAAQPTLVVTAAATFEGRAGGRAVSGSYAPSLSFDVGALELTLASQPSGAGPPGASALTQTKTAEVQVPTLESAAVSLFGRSVRVGALRALTAGGTSLSLLVALAIALWDRQRRRQGEPAQIEARYGPELVAVRTSPDDGARAVVEVMEMTALAKLAETYGTVILSHEHDGTHSYYVDGGTTTIFCYRPAPRPQHEARQVRDRAYEPRHRAGTARPAFPGPGRGAQRPWFARAGRSGETAPGPS